MAEDVISRLAATIRSRREASVAASYTRTLLDGGPARCARKLGEEATETIIAALAEDDAKLAAEAADLVYHLLVLLEARGVEWQAVESILTARQGTSGHDDKRTRSDARG